MTVNPSRLSLKKIKYGLAAAVVVVAFTTVQLENEALASGSWGLAQPAQFPDVVQPNTSEFSSVSCSSAGNCTAVGRFWTIDIYTKSFTMTSTNGAWELAQPALSGEGIQFEYSEFYAVSCPTDGNCTTVGYFLDSGGNGYEAFTMTSANGVWELAQRAQFPGDNGPQARFRSVSCSSPGNCTAVGTFVNSDGNDEAFTMTSIDGEWDTARPAQLEEDNQCDEP